MKKLLVIVVPGLLLFSCSNSESDKMKMIEICADIEFENESGVEPTDVLSIKEKINLDKDYEDWFVICENALKKNPETFKAKYILKSKFLLNK